MQCVLCRTHSLSFFLRPYLLPSITHSLANTPPHSPARATKRVLFFGILHPFRTMEERKKILHRTHPLSLLCSLCLSLPLWYTHTHTHTLSLTHTHTRMRRYAGGGCRLRSHGARIEFHNHRACQKEPCMSIKTAPYMYPHIHAAQKTGGNDV